MGTMANFNVLATVGSANQQAPSALAVTSSGAAVDLRGYINPGGRQMKAVLNVGNVTSTGTLNVRMQQSSTTAEAGFADITGAAFTATGTSASLTGSEEIHFRATQRYVRAISALADTGNLERSVYVVAERRTT